MHLKPQIPHMSDYWLLLAGQAPSIANQKSKIQRPLTGVSLCITMYHRVSLCITVYHQHLIGGGGLNPISHALESGGQPSDFKSQIPIHAMTDNRLLISDY